MGLAVVGEHLADECHSGSLGAHLPVDPCDLSPHLGYLATKRCQFTEEAPQEQTPSDDDDYAERTRDHGHGHATFPCECARRASYKFGFVRGIDGAPVTARRHAYSRGT
jgi:hypothetical protein